MLHHELMLTLLAYVAGPHHTEAYSSMVRARYTNTIGLSIRGLQ